MKKRSMSSLDYQELEQIIMMNSYYSERIRYILNSIKYKNPSESIKNSLLAKIEDCKSECANCIKILVDYGFTYQEVKRFHDRSKTKKP